ncbi:lysophospholipid acyltransferase family protein [Parabacteroides sp. PF5-9]|uniref:lysophospholipid acyltransferase family protein n=1 Tax=Parabacteroides sp. PF5-9 TaxID=1742404 RepID=UPI002475141C|nr:lysophospholipid acyltransferase family protein [Parabacteroides sp. PF5-9]MDH6358037.1 putative hemolysin [Parabacteroides sp. PF5-9]
MKETVVDINDLQKIVPFFRSRFGKLIGKAAIKLFSIDKVNRVHANNCHLRGSAFTSAILNDPIIDLKYEVHNKEILESLPEGAFITVSNHPIGSLDGIMLIDIFASRRPDFKVMVNGILTQIGAMDDNFISVVPDSTNKGANLANVNGVRLSLQRLREGHPMGFFPAGAISFYDKKKKKIEDLSWAHSVIRLIRKGNVPVYPVYFDFLNTRFFYWLGNIDWRIRTLRIPVEAFNKRGKKADVYIGDPIPPEEIQSITDDEALADFLYKRTYASKK